MSSSQSPSWCFLQGALQRAAAVLAAALASYALIKALHKQQKPAPRTDFASYLKDPGKPEGALLPRKCA